MEQSSHVNAVSIIWITCTCALEIYFNMHYSYPPWSYNSYMPFPLRYFCSDYITYKESAIKRSPPTSNDRFNHKNRYVQKNTHKVTKQVYHVKKDGRLSKNSDLT